MKCTEPLIAEATQGLTICVASSFEWTQLATPIIIFISAIVAYFGVQMARRTARQRATLDLIEKVESTPHYRERHEVFSRYRRNSAFNVLHSPTDKKEVQERQHVLDYLNHYELVSIGILEKILDEGIYRSWMLHPFVRDWNAAADFVQRERWKWNEEDRKWEYHDPLFAAYQSVARRWSTDAVSISEKTAPPPESPQGPGDEAYPEADSEIPN